MDIYLQPMEKAQMHAFYQEFEYDPDTFSDHTTPGAYVYEEGRVDALFEKHSASGKPHFAVIYDGEVVGDVYFKHIDRAKKQCELGIHLKNDRFKNKGIGTKAEILALEYAFQTLGMETVLADALIKNTRSCHVLEKAGFTKTNMDDKFCYFKCEKEKWYKR